MQSSPSEKEQRVGVRLRGERQVGSSHSSSPGLRTQEGPSLWLPGFGDLWKQGSFPNRNNSDFSYTIASDMERGAMKPPSGYHKSGGGGSGESWRLSPLARLCHVRRTRTGNKETYFSTLLLWHLVFIVCSTNLSPLLFFHLPLSANPFKCNSILKAALSCMSNECQGDAITMGPRRVQSAVCVQVI